MFGKLLASGLKALGSTVALPRHGLNEAASLATKAASLGVHGGPAAAKFAWSVSNKRMIGGAMAFGAGALLKSDTLEHNYFQGYAGRYGEDRAESLRDKANFVGTSLKVAGVASFVSGGISKFKKRGSEKASKRRALKKKARERRDSKKFGIPKSLLGFKKPIMIGTVVGATAGAIGTSYSFNEAPKKRMKRDIYGRSSYRGTVRGLRPASLGGLAPGLQFSTGQGASLKPSKYSKRVI